MTQSASSQNSPFQTALIHAAYGLVVAPLTIIAHELGHFGVGLIVGAPDLALHYGSVTDTASEQGFASAKIGAQAIAGPIVTLLIMVACVFGLRRKPHPLFVAALIAAPVRFAVGAVYLAFSILAAVRGQPRGQPDFDEFNAAQAFGFPVEPLIVLELVVTLVIWSWLFRRLLGSPRLISIGSAVVGAVIGIGIWMGIVGPRLLP